MVQNSTKQVIVASMSSFLTAAAIVASGSGIGLWEEYLNLSGAEKGLLSGLSANCLGAAIGAFVGGFTADRFGRKNVFSLATLFFLLGIGLTGTATTFGQLLTGIILTGIAAGTSVVSSWAYIAEVSEPEHRGRNIAISQFAWGFGAAGAVWLSTANSPGSYWFALVQFGADLWGVPSNHTAQINVFGSRLIFLVIYIFAFVTWILQRQIPESQVWTKEAEEHEGKGTKITYAMYHILGPKYRKAFNAITLMYLFWNIVASLMGFFQSDIYEKVANLPAEWANRFVVWQWVLTCIITFWAMFVIDKWSHKKLFAAFSSCAILAWVITVFCDISQIPFLTLITVLWAIQAGVSIQLFFALWGTEVFPTKYRAAAIGLMFGMVRLICTLPNVGFASVWGASGSIFTISSAILLVMIIIASVIGYCYAPNTAGRSLEDISMERYGKK